ncbi:Cyclin domain containing protein [Naviculisporaceae sp. PSN 640]
MGTAYQIPNMTAYENHHMHHSSYGSTIPPADRTRTALNERSLPNEQLFNPLPRCSSNQPSQRQVQPQQQYPVSQQTRNASSSTVASTVSVTQTSRQSSSRQETRATTPASEHETSARDAVMATHSLRIPKCISPEGGNLADFVADLTALFWFESIKVLETAENFRSLAPTTPVRRIPAASQNFHKWVHQVLSTTQVTQNVILLALMFIYRLKNATRTVKGRPGSEYRLLTVALMLGNKFLDDNTYTNKTWADVSGISVGEIHVMEVEFLSNMRYSLLASKEQWEEWLVKLAQFYEYMQRAQRSPSPSPLLIPSPTARASDAVSPASSATLQLTPSLRPVQHPVYNFSPTATSFSSATSGHSWDSASNTLSPLTLRPEVQPSLSRKRSFPEDDPTEPPAKRMSRLVPQLPSQQPQYAAPAHQLPSQAPRQQAPVPPVQSRPPVTASSDYTRLSVPNLTLNTSHNVTVTTAAQPYTGVAYAPPQASPLSLPPLVPGVRAMSTVFPPVTTTSYAPQSVTASCSAMSGPGIPSIAPVTTPVTAFPPASYGTPTKRLSPQSSFTPGGHYAASSPLTESFPRHALGTSSGVHTPISNSPSIYLQQRNSPYRPVRHVNTLLYPPPSSFLQQYHLVNSVPPNQMHYQPLGRRNEVRTGILPEFSMGGGNFAPVRADETSTRSNTSAELRCTNRLIYSMFRTGQTG